MSDAAEQNTTGASEHPRVFVEPPVPLTTEFASVDAVRAVIQQLDTGSFRMPAILVERMLWNPRLRAVLETRLAGLISTTMRFEPSRNNRDARRAAKEFEEDWPLIASSPMRKQMWKWSLLLGFGLGQRIPTTSPRSGRLLPVMHPYWPGFAYWYWSTKTYKVQTFNAGVVDQRSPSVSPMEVPAYGVMSPSTPPPSESPWVVSEPFGVNSYRDGIVHASWRPWLGHEWAMRDQARSSEKNGVGIIKLFYPRGTGPEHRAAVERTQRAMGSGAGSEGVWPFERRPEDGPEGGFDAEPFEFNGAGFQAISDTMNANAVALAILFLGHNLTTEIKGGSYAAAGVAEYIRDDKKNEDAAGEWAYAGPQLAEVWAEWNYGDPGLAPIAVYVTDSPNVNKQAADTINALGQAITQLRQYAPEADIPALLERFRVPLVALGSTQVVVPGLSEKSAAPATANDKDAGDGEPESEDQP